MKIMGILNVTPDSFSDGGRYVDVEKAVDHALHMIQDGAEIIDIGGESTRPGAVPVSLDEELTRVIPVIKRLREVTDVSISIDTYKATVAQEAVKAGATLINDVWSGQRDSNMLQVMAKSHVPVILTHNRTPEMENEHMINIVDEVVMELRQVIQLALSAGVDKAHIIVDPGIGFGKTLAQNVALIKHIDRLKQLGYPVMLAASKKRTIRSLVESEALLLSSIGTIATTCHAFSKGIDYVRVHDVKENKAAIRVMAGLDD
ncbi:MAG: dihydropteroate synthase [Defluviitaleaceae bacterium]|nr:dihydropteroate synthase [Defluviitaleaceae bacterium]